MSYIAAAVGLAAASVPDSDVSRVILRCLTAQHLQPLAGLSPHLYAAVVGGRVRLADSLEFGNDAATAALLLDGVAPEWIREWQNGR